MHKPTLIAGIVIAFFGVILAANAAATIMAFCYGGKVSFDYCQFGIQFILTGTLSAVFVSAIGAWLIILRLESISARTVMTKTPFVIGFLAAGIALLLTSMLGVFLIQVDEEVAFRYNDSMIEYFPVLIPIGIISFLLGLAGLLMYYVKSPARLLMWILVFVAMATAGSLLTFGSPVGLAIGIVAFIGTYWFLRNRIAVASNIVVAAVILGSIAVVVLVFYIPSMLFDYGYSEIKPEVTVARNKIVDSVGGIALTRVDNASRVLSPDCLRNEPDCKKRYGEGLAELEMYYGRTEDGHQIISSVITNTGTSIINVTDFMIDGSSSSSYQELVAYGVESSSGGISFGGWPFLFFGDGQYKSDAPITEPVTLKPEESLSIYIKGKWNSSDSGTLITTFGSSASYNYYIEPLIWHSPDASEENVCAPGCDTAPRVISNPQYWSLGTYYGRESNPDGTIYIRSPAISYAGCINQQDATRLLAARNLTVNFPAYIPDGFSSVCVIDGDAHSIVQILANETAMQRGDIRQDPRLLNDASIEDKGGVITVSAQLTPWQNFNETAYEEYTYYVKNNDPEFIGKTSFQVIKGNSVVIEENYSGASVDVYTNGEKYSIIGMMPASELIRIAESLM